MSKDKVFRLVYINFGTPELEKMTNYYHEIMGYSIEKREENQINYLSNGFDHHNIILTHSNKSEVINYGYQLTDKYSLEEYSDYLSQKGFSNEIKNNIVAGVSELIEVKDPSGNVLHLFQSIDMAKSNYSNKGIAPFKLGHVAFYSNVIKETINFYQEILDFYCTDTIADGFANFLTCNYEHHVINIIDSPESGLHHIAFQLKDASHHFNSSDFLTKANIPVLWGPSRHTAGHNIAAYHKDPDGNIVELYTDMDILIPELGIFEPRPWHEEIPLKPRNWNELSAWGTNFAFDLAKGE